MGSNERHNSKHFTSLTSGKLQGMKWRIITLRKRPAKATHRIGEKDWALSTQHFFVMKRYGICCLSDIPVSTLVKSIL